jgi:HTH-type transcriptional regulator / antitoxin HigA
MATKTPCPLADPYMTLLHEFRLRPIRDEETHRHAVEVLDRLSDRGPGRTPEENQYMVVLGLLVEDYENSIYGHPDISGVEMLRFLMEENGMTQARLSEETGIPEPSLSEILNGKRGISPKVRKKLCERFGADPSVFLSS